MTLIFLSLLVHNVQIQVLFEPILHYWCHNWGQSFKNFQISFINIFLIFNVSLPMDFDFFSPIVPYMQIWACFGLILEWPQNEGLGMGHNITVLKNWSQKWIASVKKSLSQFEYSIQIWPLFVSIYYDATRIVKFPIPNFGKMMEDQIFHLKQYTWFQV